MTISVAQMHSVLWQLVNKDFHRCDSDLPWGTATAEQQNTCTDNWSKGCNFNMNFNKIASVAHCTGMSSVQLCHRQVTHKHLTRNENESNFMQNLTKEIFQFCVMLSTHTVVCQTVTVCLPQHHASIFWVEIIFIIAIGPDCTLSSPPLPWILAIAFL